MNEHRLFLQALNLALQLSDVGDALLDVRFYPGIGELVISFQDRTATVRGKLWSLSSMELMQLVVAVISEETGGKQK